MSKRRISHPSSRGFAMVFALFVVALLLVVGLAMLAVSQNSASATLNMEYKQTAFDAAEAGLNQGIDRLDASQGFSSSGSGALSNGYTYTYSVKNNLANPNPILNFTDPASGNSVTIPGNRALVVSTGQGPDGQRVTAVEAIVKNTQTTVAFPNDAIDAGLDIQGNWNHKIGVAGSAPGVNDATVHANNDITASIGFLGGSATASGTIDSLNPGPGGINTPQKVLPTAQLTPFVAAEMAIAKAGGPYALYIPANGSLPATFDCPSGAPANGCTVFFDGPLHMSGQTTISFTGRVLLVINGDYSSTGSSGITFQGGTKSLFVVNGNADIGGNGTAAALIWAKGDTTLHGNGFQLGALVSGGNVNFAGGGANGGFKYDPSLNNFSITIPGHIVVMTYGER
jgi:Tfp pilus assembly protein PilX